jgi:hypothetical protein
LLLKLSIVKEEFVQFANEDRQWTRSINGWREVVPYSVRTLEDSKGLIYRFESKREGI